jgi:hypothetical protein
VFCDTSIMAIAHILVDLDLQEGLEKCMILNQGCNIPDIKKYAEHK